MEEIVRYCFCDQTLTKPDHKPVNYDGTSIDPLEVFIRSGMTDNIGVVKTGNGRIGASFR